MPLNPSAAEIGIIKDNWVNTMAAEALDPCVANDSFDMQDKQVPVLYGRKFHLPAQP